MYVNPYLTQITRKEWNLIDLSGILGGIASALTVIAGFFLQPFVDHLFKMKAISSLFIVKQIN